MIQQFCQKFYVMFISIYHQYSENAYPLCGAIHHQKYVTLKDFFKCEIHRLK